MKGKGRGKDANAIESSVVADSQASHQQSQPDMPMMSIPIELDAKSLEVQWEPVHRGKGWAMHELPQSAPARPFGCDANPESVFSQMAGFTDLEGVEAGIRPKCHGVGCCSEGAQVGISPEGLDGGFDHAAKAGISPDGQGRDTI